MPHALGGGLRRGHQRRRSTASFHGLGMNLVAMTDLIAATLGLVRQQAADDALALAAAIDLGRVEEDDAGLDAGLPGIEDRLLAVRRVVAAHAPGALVTPGPGTDPEGRHRDVRAAQGDAVIGLGCVVGGHGMRSVLFRSRGVLRSRYLFRSRGERGDAPPPHAIAAGGSAAANGTRPR